MRGFEGTAIAAVHEHKAVLAHAAVENARRRTASRHPPSAAGFRMHIIGEHFERRGASSCRAAFFFPLWEQRSIGASKKGRGKETRAGAMPRMIRVERAASSVRGRYRRRRRRESAERATRPRRVASSCAGEIYGLTSLAQKIEDAEHNTDAALAMAREAARRRTAEPDRPDHSSSTCAKVAAALYKALGGSTTNGINMTKMRACKCRRAIYATQFYADVEGHHEDRPLVSPRGARLLLARGPHLGSTAATPSDTPAQRSRQISRH